MVLQFSSLMYDPSEYAKEMRQNYFQQQHHMFVDKYQHKQECYPAFNVNKTGGTHLGNYYSDNDIVDISSWLSNRHHEIRGFDTQMYYKPDQKVYNSKPLRKFKEQHQKMKTIIAKPRAQQPMLSGCAFFENKKFYEKF